MNRDDVIRITEDVLRGLELDIEEGHFTDPNSRTVLLKLNGKTVASATFDVVQKDEYEG